MKTKILSILMVLVISAIAIPMSVFAVSDPATSTVVGTVILDNKNPVTWARLNTDGTYAILTYNSVGSTFDWTLSATGL
jgi:hypothetical protein